MEATDAVAKQAIQEQGIKLLTDAGQQVLLD